MNTADVCDSKEKGRQGLNAADWVMLVKNERHDTLEKLRVNCGS